MDHGRKFNKTVAPLASKRPKLPFVTTTDSSFVKDDIIVEDHRLVNWRKWLRRHHVQYQALDKAGLRSKADLVMNSYATKRPQAEMRNLMEYASTSIPSVPGECQGNPGFWKIPPLLPSHGNPCLSEVGPVLTKKELNLPPTFEYVDTPTCFREEKSLPDPSEKEPAWKHSSYLKKRRQELAETIAILQPTAPDIANLITRGQGFGRGAKIVSHLPVISIMDMSLGNDDSEVESRELSLNTDVIVAIKINDVEIRSDEESSNNDSEEITWSLNFSSKVAQKSEQRLYLENTGTVAITYQWRKAVNSLRGDVGFFFNKNKALILPGQKIEFPIWFQTQLAGIFSENWFLKTNPIVFRAAFVIRMRGYAASEDLLTSQMDVNVYLDRCIQNTAIRETIDEIISNIRPSGLPEPAYKTLYLEEKLFRDKNPSYFYHASLVAQFHRLYATESATGASWTLSLVDLRRALLGIENPDLRHDRLKEYSNVCNQCLVPSLYHPVRNTKYAVVYNLLCALVNRMEDESDFVKRNSIIKNTNNTTLTGKEGTIIHEIDSATPLKSSSTQTPKNKRSSRTFRSSRNSLVPTLDVRPLTATLDCSTLALYREIFYVRIYGLLVEAVEQACTVIDSLNNLHELQEA